MNGKYAATLRAVFTDPVSGTIAWATIERLRIAAGCQVVEGSGSRVRFVKAGIIETFIGRTRPRKRNDIRFALRARIWSDWEWRHERCPDVQGL